MNDNFHEKNTLFPEEEADDEMFFTQAPPPDDDDDDDESLYDDGDQDILLPSSKENDDGETNPTSKRINTSNHMLHTSPSSTSLQVKELKHDVAHHTKETNDQDKHDDSYNRNDTIERNKSEPLIMSVEDDDSPNLGLESSEAPTVVIDDISPFKPSLESKRTWVQNSHHHRNQEHSQASGFTELEQEYAGDHKDYGAESVSRVIHEKTDTSRTLDFDKALSHGFTDTESVDDMIETEENDDHDPNSNVDQDCFMTQAMDQSFHNADLGSDSGLEEEEEDVKETEKNTRSANPDNIIDNTTVKSKDFKHDEQNVLMEEIPEKDSYSKRNMDVIDDSKDKFMDLVEENHNSIHQEDSMVSIFNGETQSFPAHLSSTSLKMSSSSPQSRLEQLPASPESAAKTGYTYDSNIGTNTQYLSLDLALGSMSHSETVQNETPKIPDENVAQVHNAQLTGSQKFEEQKCQSENVDDGKSPEEGNLSIHHSHKGNTIGSHSDENMKITQNRTNALENGIHVLDPTLTPLHDTLSYPLENHDIKSPLVKPFAKEHTPESIGPTPISQILLEPKKPNGFSLEIVSKVNNKPSPSRTKSIDEIDDSSDEEDQKRPSTDMDTSHGELGNISGTVESDGEETQMESSKHKLKAKDTIAHNNNNNKDLEEDESDLQDTQESDNIPIAALKRIKRGILETKKGGSEVEDESGSEAEWNDSDNDALASQFTEEIKVQLDKFASYDVKKITSHLLQTPLAENTKLRKQIQTLSSEKKILETRNAILSKENSDLSKQLSVTSEQLKSKNELCAEMKSQLDELQPLLEALQQVGGLQLGNFQKKTSAIRTPKTPRDTKHGHKSPRKVLNFATPITPKSDTVKAGNLVSASTRKAKKKPRIRGNTTFHDLWDILQEHGWTYRQGPEPFNMVYKPPFGSVKSGSKLGKDFFEADELLWEYAASMGYIDEGEPQSQVLNGAELEQNDPESEDDQSTVEVLSAKERLSGRDNLSRDSNMGQWDNTKLCGQLRIMTERSRHMCSHLIHSFLSGSSGGGFMATLWKPLWDCMKDEQTQVDKSLGWTYCKSIGAGNLGRSHWFCPPCSVNRAKGIEGKDYFTTEEAVLSYVIRDLKSSKDLISVINHEKLELLEIKLSRAIEQHISFDELGDVSGPESTRGQRRKVVPSSSETKKEKKKKYDLGIDSEYNDRKAMEGGKGKDHDSELTLPRSPTLKTSNTTSDFSQRTKEGAKILAAMNNVQMPSQTIAPYHSIATEKGIMTVLKMRKPDYGKKRKKIEHVNTSSASKRFKSSPQPTFHCTQDPSDISPFLNSSTTKLTNRDSSALPLSGLSFFGSGLDESTPKLVEDLGGVFKRDIRGEDLKRSNVSRKLFFLSTPDKRRTHKYFLAVALGVPMLHINWLNKMADEYKQYTESGSKGPMPSAFNSENYSQYRLPLGLSNISGTFVLQKPGHANKWLGPSDILKGLSISIVVTDPNLEAKWSDIIRACGAHVVNSKHVDRKDVTLDIALVDPVCFPPQSTAVPSKVSSTLNKIKNCQQNTKVLDLAWVTSSLVLRHPVDISDRYLIEWAGRGTSVSSPNESRGSNTKQLYSIKVNRFNKGYARYEVGDSVMFGKPKQISYGRIESIYNDRIKRKNFVTVQILELHNGTDLMDGGSSPCTVTIDETDLYGHVILLREKDFETVEWRHDTNVFQQRKPH